MYLYLYFIIVSLFDEQMEIKNNTNTNLITAELEIVKLPHTIISIFTYSDTLKLMFTKTTDFLSFRDIPSLHNLHIPILCLLKFRIKMNMPQMHHLHVLFL